MGGGAVRLAVGVRAVRSVAGVRLSVRRAALGLGALRPGVLGLRALALRLRGVGGSGAVSSRPPVDEDLLAVRARCNRLVRGGCGSRPVGCGPAARRGVRPLPHDRQAEPGAGSVRASRRAVEAVAARAAGRRVDAGALVADLSPPWLSALTDARRCYDRRRGRSRRLPSGTGEPSDRGSRNSRVRTVPGRGLHLAALSSRLVTARSSACESPTAVQAGLGVELHGGGPPGTRSTAPDDDVGEVHGRVHGGWAGPRGTARPGRPPGR